MSATGTVTVPGPSGTIVLTFTGTANLGLAQQIANALAAASTNSTLTVVNYTGGSTIPPAAPGTTEELVLNATGSVTIPAAASGVTEILVLPDTVGPVTIHGNSNLEIVGGNGNITVIDPFILDLGGTNTSTGADAVTVTAADSPYLVMGGPGAVESITGLGSGTIYGGVGGDLINLTGSSGSNLVISTASVPGFGDTVFAGSGTTTVDNVVGSAGAYDIGGLGSMSVDDLGTNDTIAVRLGNVAATLGGSGALVYGGVGNLSILDTAAGSTIDGGTGGLTATIAGSNDLVFSGAATSQLDLAGSSGATIIGDTGAITVTAGSASNALVYGPTSGGGMDFIGGSGSASVFGQAGSDTITGGSGPLLAVAGANETMDVTGGGAGTTLFAGSGGSDITYAGTTGALVYVAGAGNVTLNASGSTTNNFYWAGAAGDTTATESIVGGSGNNEMVVGPGSDTLTGGSANNVYDFIATIVGTSSIASAGNTDVITNILSGNSAVDLSGGLSTMSAATAGSETTVTLSDNTKITFLGVTSSSELTGHIFSS
jgi:Ca2+-binding RTX toxin-like protein